MIVGDQDVACVVYANPYRVVGDTLTPDLPHEHALIGEHLQEEECSLFDAKTSA